MSAGPSTRTPSVLVVGAGPTGLSLAVELQRRGVPYRHRREGGGALGQVARAGGAGALARADAAVGRLRRAGGARAKVLERAVLRREAAERATSSSAISAIDDTPYPHLLFVSQAETERLLDEALSGLGGRDRTRRRAGRGARTTGDGVDVDVAATATARGERALRLGRRLRRRALAGAPRRGLEFDGAAYEQDFVLADLALEWDAPERLYVFLGKGATPSSSRCATARSASSATGATTAEGAPDEPSLEELRALLAERLPVSPSASGDVALEGALPPAPSRRVALSRRAALRRRRRRAHPQPRRRPGHEHRHPGRDQPRLEAGAGGEGRAPTTLLDSYDEERRPVGQRLLQFTDRLFSAATSANPLVIWARNQLVPVFAPLMMRTPARRKLAFRFVSQLGISYKGSSLVGELRRARARRDVDGQASRRRLRNAAPSPRRLRRRRRARRSCARRRRASRPSSTASSSTTPRRAPAIGVAGDGWVLVRPDQYIAARAQSLRRRAARRLLRRQDRDELVEAIDVILRRRRGDGFGRRVAVGHQAQVDAGGVAPSPRRRGCRRRRASAARQAPTLPRRMSTISGSGLRAPTSSSPRMATNSLGDAELVEDGARQLARLVGGDRLVAVERAQRLAHAQIGPRVLARLRGVGGAKARDRCRRARAGATPARSSSTRTPEPTQPATAASAMRAAERAVERVGDVADGVDEGAVEIEDDEVVHGVIAYAVERV